jgi:hypothetical protein
MGVSDVTYRSHENGARIPSLTDIETYAAFLAVSPGWIAFGDTMAGGDTYLERLVRVEAGVRRIEKMVSGGFKPALE